MLYFDDINVGDKYSAGPYRLEADEIMSFAAKWDPFEFHMDMEAAENSMYGGLTASGVLTLCINNRLGHALEAWSILAMFGAEYRLPNPARVGDELTNHRTVLSKRESKSRPEAGIIESEDQMTNQDGIIVLEQKSAVLVLRKSLRGV
jgi:acyl dehydratase